MDRTLPLIDDEVGSAPCVLALPDDAEYGTSVCAARWTDQGIPVAYLPPAKAFLTVSCVQQGEATGVEHAGLFRVLQG